MNIVFNKKKDQFFSWNYKGDNETFLELFKMFKDNVYSYSLHLTHSEIIAEDITQEVFMKLWTSRKSISSINNMEAWLITVTRNLCFNQLKRNAQQQKLCQLIADNGQEMNCEENVDEYILYKDKLKQLKEVVNHLPPQQRIIFNLNRNEGLRNEEIALRLNISTNTVKSHFGKALRTLRQTIQIDPIILIIAGLLSKYFF